MTRSFGGRARQYQRLTRIKPNRAPVPVFGVSYLETFPVDGNFGSTTLDLTWLDGFDDSPNFIASELVVVGSALTVPDNRFGAGEAQGETATDDMYVQFDWLTTHDFFHEVYLIGRSDDLLSVDLGNDCQGVAMYLTDFGGGFCQMEMAGYNGPWVEIAQVDLDNGGLGGYDLRGTWRLECEGDEARSYHDGDLIATADTSGLSPQPSGRKAGITMSVIGGTAPLSIDNFEYGDL